ncbi:MAG: peptide chain release factor 1 [Mariprofundaceae bacterium]|nr:peptide chain release factor 1 [Mariprofundaceae bacterium]
MMKDRLLEILKRRDELTTQLSDPIIISNTETYTKLSKEFASVEPVAVVIEKLNATQQQIDEYQEIIADEEDEDLLEIAQEELPELNQALINFEEELKVLLLPKDADDERNAIVEIRAGTGGDEAALFASDLMRMYSRYAEKVGFKTEILSFSGIGIGGYKEVIAQFSGQGVFSKLKFESGVHRVQRVPATETQGRIHTSACTVAVLPEADEVDSNVRNEDLRFDVYRASGPGGQSVNTTDSAVRITHLPTGLVVTCQDEKSQHKNKAKALKVLQARLYAQVKQEADDERAEARRGMVGTGDRSERIRTYNFPQSRVTDHRINLTLYKLEQILHGELEQLIEPLNESHQTQLLAATGT